MLYYFKKTSLSKPGHHNTIIYTAQIQPLAQFSTLRQSWFVVLLGLRSLWTLDVICKILCTPIFAKIALWSDEVALAIFG